MAIYHLSVQVISRAKGRSSVAAAAYRAGERILDERTGLVHDFSKRHDIESEILAPEHSPEWAKDRDLLWNAAENAEKRNDAQVAREINIALPKELTADQHRELVRNYVQDQFVNRGMIADVAIHRDNPENPHAHIMLTTRNITPEGFELKNREWNTKESLDQWREGWERHANNALERAGLQERIDHRSLEAQGITDRLPQIHEGVHARAMEAKGIQTERGDHNRMVKEHNQIVRDLAEYRQEKERWQHFTPGERDIVTRASKVLKTYVDFPKIQERLEQLNRWETKIQNSQQYLHWKEDTFKKASIILEQIENKQERIQKYQESIDKINWLNPLKIKENRQTKDSLEKWIVENKQAIASYEKDLMYSREKLGYTTKEEFHQRFDTFQSERSEEFAKIKDYTRVIREQRDLLGEAKNALENAEIRRVAAQYPDWKEARYMDYKTAHSIDLLNQKVGRVLTTQELNSEYNRLANIQKELTNRIENINSTGKRLEQADNVWNRYEEAVKRVNELDSPVNKGKRVFSENAKQQYQQSVQIMEQRKSELKPYGINGKVDLEQQKTQFQSSLVTRANYENKLESISNNPDFGLLKGIVKGLQQAEHEAKWQAERQKQRSLAKQQTRNRDYELER